MRWPIRHQILVPFAAISLSIVMAVSLFSAYLATRRAERRVEVEVRRLGRTLQTSSFPLTDAVLEQLRGLSGAHFVVGDAEERIVASSGPPQRGPDLKTLNRTTAPVNDWRRLGLGPLVRVGNEDYFVSALTVDRRGRDGQSAVLHILYPESHWADSRREAALPPLLGGLATLTLSVLLSAVIAGRISRPIARLRLQVTRLANGDFATLALPARDDELQDLARSVNVLADQLVQMRHAIRRSERLTLLGQLSGALAHHLRNDITGTRMAVELHQRSCQEGDRESLAVALRQLELTEQHLQRLLAAGQPQEPRRCLCDVEEVVRHVVRLVEPSCLHRGIALSLALVANEGPPRPFPSEADAHQLRHLLMNLVVNAMEAAGAGGWVRVELENTATAVVVRLLDSGPGLPGEVAEQLFEAFVTTKAEGVGLGLAVARQIAESHGGRLSHTRRGGHTCFELLLPRAAGAALPDVGSGASTPAENAWLTC